MHRRPDHIHGHLLRRREALALLAGAGGIAVLSGRIGGLAHAAGGAAARACVLTPEVTAGPYYIPNDLFRRDIRDGQPGLPLQLHLRVQDAGTCAAIAAADVELWHANASGVYSGYDAAASPGLRFLRGHQRTDARGVAIYSGWYRGRAPHVHVRVHVGGTVVHTGQLFFPDTLSDAVYRTVAYRAHGQADTTDAADSIYHQAAGAGAQLKLKRELAIGGYVGALTMAVRR